MTAAARADNDFDLSVQIWSRSPTRDLAGFLLTNSLSEFSSLNLPDLPDGLLWNTSQLYTTGTLFVTDPSGLIPEPASLALLVLPGLLLARRKR
jgi:hypothetical protein